MAASHDDRTLSDRHAAYARRLLKTWQVFQACNQDIHRTARSLGMSIRCIRDRLRDIRRYGVEALTRACQRADGVDAGACDAAPSANGSDAALSTAHDAAHDDRVRELEQRLQVYEALESASSTYEIPAFSPSLGHAVPVAVLSDVHLGETVDARDIPEQRNEYNLDIAQRRVEQFFQRVVFMNQRVARSLADVDTMVLALLGDLMTGYIHEELRETNSLTPIQEVLALEELLNAGIEYLLSKGDYKTIIVPCCHGNHGRTTFTMRAKHSAETSYEWLLYRHLAHRWRHERRLQWLIASSYHQYVKIYQTTLRFHHGDAISYRNGVGGLTIPLRKAIHQWNSVCYADVDVMGHWHQFMDGGHFVVNGSVIGMSAYAVRMCFPYEPPQQAWFLIDAKRGKTMTARLFTDFLPDRGGSRGSSS